VLRRAPLSLPYPDQVEALAGVLLGRPAEPQSPERFAAAAVHHGLAGYAAAGDVSLPPRARRRLADAHARGVAHTALMRRELAAIAAPLGEAAAPPIALKGPAVADRYYPDRTLRPYADLDLLLPRERLAEGVEALIELGYQALEEFRPGYAETHGHDVHLRRAIGSHRIAVELHWRVGDDPLGERLGYATLAEGAEELEPGVLAPPSPVQLLVLAVHFLGDRARRLAWIHDLALVGAALDEDGWSEAFARARALGLDWPLDRALDYACRYLGFDRPRPFAPGPAPRWGPLRAVEDLDARAAPHLGRLAVLDWPERASYLRAVLLPTAAGLRGTAGGDGAGLPRLAARHAARILLAIIPQRR
jgi:hypothetical protein